MARPRATATPLPRPAPATIDRRTLLSLGAPVLVTAGIAAALPSAANTGAEDTAAPLNKTNNETGLTAHRRAYYDRARF